MGPLHNQEYHYHRILEKVQRRATKFILADWLQNSLTSLRYSAFNVYAIYLYDIMFLIKALQQPSPQFIIMQP